MEKAGTPRQSHTVFISYSTEDKTVADDLCAALESAGIFCWIAAGPGSVALRRQA
jgi:hypothetical protein